MRIVARKHREEMLEQVLPDGTGQISCESNQEFHVVSGQLRDPNQDKTSSSSILSLPLTDRLLNAREVAQKLGVSERWVRDHTTRRSPRIRALKMGTLIRYRWTDVELFMAGLDTLRPSRQSRFGV